VFKKLDKLIIKAFIGPFVATFFITLLVLVMQFFWLYIDDFVGKGLNVGVIFEFILYQSAALVPLALPLAVLLSSIMTFGNLGESYELVAIKSAGISLLRFMRPLFFVTLFICYIAFLFANNIIPVANLKSRTLLIDIVGSQPSFDLKEGVFYDKINGFSIKIGKKENDSVIRNIIIYEQNNALQDNFIIAADGIMRAAKNKRFLEFNLKNGTRYEERGSNTSGRTDYIRLSFKEYSRLFDISNFGLKTRTSDTVYRNNAKMLSMRQLEVAMDSLRKINARISKKVKDEVFLNVRFLNYLDSANRVPDSVKKKTYKSFDQLIPDTIRSQINQQAANKVGMMKVANETAITQHKDDQYNMRVHQIEWHRKIALSAACLVLFLIGAPLGSIIRKGGLGSPLVFAIVFFMVFYFSSTTGEKFAKTGTMLPFYGMWLSTFVLLPIATFLIYKAMRDSQLFSKEFYTRYIQRLRARRKSRA
jgi:lipopolysaccharide export system permease protein